MRAAVSISTQARGGEIGLSRRFTKMRVAADGASASSRLPWLCGAGCLAYAVSIGGYSFVFLFFRNGEGDTYARNCVARAFIRW